MPPLFPELAASLRMSSAALSVLAALPVLCFGVFSGAGAPAQPAVRRGAGARAALVVLAAGLALRGAFPGAMLYPGTALAALAIALLNVLLPSLVKRRNPERAGLLLGIYLSALSAGAILASLIAIPVYPPALVPLTAAPAAAAAPQARPGAVAQPRVPHPAHRDARSRCGVPRPRPPRLPWCPGTRAARLPARPDLAGNRIHGAAEPDLLRDPVLAAHHVPVHSRDQPGGGRSRFCPP